MVCRLERERERESTWLVATDVLDDYGVIFFGLVLMCKVDRYGHLVVIRKGTDNQYSSIN